MRLIKEEKFKKIVSQGFGFEFGIAAEGLYLIEISARARSEKQIGDNETDDDDLRIEIDGRKFAQPGEPVRYFDGPAAFSGGQLHNLKKTVVFLYQFSEGKHVLAFVPDREPTLEEIKIYQPQIDGGKINLELNQQAEDGDRRDWYAFALIDLPLKEISIELTCQKRKWDRDDVKIIIDGQTRRNLKNGIRRFWYWLGAFFDGKSQSDTFAVNLTKGIHYIEFWADRMPTLNRVMLNFGDASLKRIPTVYDPKWTGEFHDDSEKMILARAIFGEAGNQIRDARIAVGWSIKNRLGKDVYPWRDYKTYNDVVLAPKQYDAFVDPRVSPKLEDPLNEIYNERRAWFECYEIAELVFDEKVRDVSEGAVFFHDISIPQPSFLKANPNAKYIKQIDDLLFYGI